MEWDRGSVPGRTGRSGSRKVRLGGREQGGVQARSEVIIQNAGREAVVVEKLNFGNARIRGEANGRASTVCGVGGERNAL